MTSAAIYGCLGHRLTEAEKAFFAEVRRAQPYRDLPRQDFDDTFDFVATGGYALAAAVVEGLQAADQLIASVPFDDYALYNGACSYARAAERARSHCPVARSRPFRTARRL